MSTTAKIFDLFSGRQVKPNSKLQLMDVSMEMNFICPEGHMFKVHIPMNEIGKYGVNGAYHQYLNHHVNMHCPECSKEVENENVDKQDQGKYR